MSYRWVSGSGNWTLYWFCLCPSRSSSYSSYRTKHAHCTVTPPTNERNSKPLWVHNMARTKKDVANYTGGVQTEDGRTLYGLDAEAYLKIKAKEDPELERKVT